MQKLQQKTELFGHFRPRPVREPEKQYQAICCEDGDLIVLYWEYESGNYTPRVVKSPFDDTHTFYQILDQKNFKFDFDGDFQSFLKSLYEVFVQFPDQSPKARDYIDQYAWFIMSKIYGSKNTQSITSEYKKFADDQIRIFGKWRF